MKQKILLHACCAPCTAGVYDELIQNYDVILFWYNPNIFPKTEHDRRLNELLNFCDTKNIKILVGDYSWEEENDFWLKKIKGLENEPEKGKRCEICYKMRLEAVAVVAEQTNEHHKNEFDFFATTLSISPYKDAETINRIGEKIASGCHSEFISESHRASNKIPKQVRNDKGNPLKYFSADFKKNDGAKLASKISKELNLYRQNYCGCEFSINKKALD